MCFSLEMGCPQSKSKSKNIAGDEDIGNGHGAKLRNDGVRPTTEETKAPTKSVDDHKDADDPINKGIQRISKLVVGGGGWGLG